MMKCTLTFLVAVLTFERGQGISWADKSILYQDCEIFSKEHVYGGPVCGNDGVTYANSLYLDCMNYHNFRNVATMHSGPCIPVDEYCKANLLYEPVCGTDGITYTNLESLLCVNYKHSRNSTVKSKGVCENSDTCYRYGITLYGTNPVCASNGFTYDNAAQVKCLQKRNKELKILHDGGCTVRNVYDIYGTNETVCDIAKTRYEWNPVCASDNVTYTNPFEFLCYEAGLKRLVSDDECGTVTQQSCAQLGFDDAASKNETLSPEDEVCGSDGVTYRSINHLQCQTSRNKYLFLKHEGSCSGPDDSPCGSIPDEDHRFPVCGSDGSSYVSPEALWCAKFKYTAKKLTLVHDGPC